MEDLKALMLTCKRCGHTWLRRVATLPKKCAHCASPYWNKEKREKKPKE